jgi:hypothetical protein
MVQLDLVVKGQTSQRHCYALSYLADEEAVLAVRAFEHYNAYLTARLVPANIRQ